MCYIKNKLRHVLRFMLSEDTWLSECCDITLITGISNSFMRWCFVSSELPCHINWSRITLLSGISNSFMCWCFMLPRLLYCLSRLLQLSCLLLTEPNFYSKIVTSPWCIKLNNSPDGYIWHLISIFFLCGIINLWLRICLSSHASVTSPKSWYIRNCFYIIPNWHN